MIVRRIFIRIILSTTPELEWSLGEKTFQEAVYRRFVSFIESIRETNQKKYSCKNYPDGGQKVACPFRLFINVHPNSPIP